MTELSEALARGERVDGLSPAEQAAAEQSLHLSTCPITDCPRCDWELSRIRAVLKAAAATIREQHLVDLSAAGRLLPEGATATSKFELSWYLPSGEGRHWGAETIEEARGLVAQVSSVAVSAEIRSQESWVGPWSVVEPVEVSARSSSSQEPV